MLLGIMLMRFVSGLAALVLCAATAQAQISACVVQDPEPPLNVRSEPNGRVVERLANGTPVLQLGVAPSDGRWVQIAAHSNGGIKAVGFVAVRYLSCTASASVLAQLACPDLWTLRNSMFKAAGYCFQTERATVAFGNDGCEHAKLGDLDFNPSQRVSLGEIQRLEQSKGCDSPTVAASASPPRPTASAEPAAATPRNPMVPREQLLPVVHAVLGDAGITEYKILAPSANDAAMVSWVYADGGYADLQALPPKFGAKIGDVANVSISRSAEACKGEFASARGQSRFHMGNEILKVETRCRANEGVTAVTYSVVELPSGVLLRFSHWTTGEPTPSEPKAERSLRVENAALNYISSAKSGLDR
jgi:YARHG domain